MKACQCKTKQPPSLLNPERRVNQQLGHSSENLTAICLYNTSPHNSISLSQLGVF